MTRRAPNEIFAVASTDVVDFRPNPNRLNLEAAAVVVPVAPHDTNLSP